MDSYTRITSYIMFGDILKICLQDLSFRIIRVAEAESLSSLSPGGPKMAPLPIDRGRLDWAGE